MQIPDTGREFEVRALAVARAIHDPSGQQGAVMFRGREHDGVFVDARSVVAFEFTVQRQRDKAVGDAEKVRDILRHLAAEPGNKYKLVQGYVVTAEEPTAEQRAGVNEVARAAEIPIQCLSLISLRRSLIDTEGYIAARRQAPFGSAGFRLSTEAVAAEGVAYVEPQFVEASLSLDLRALVDRVEDGARLVVTADFGVGKSEALRQAFERMRKAYFKAPAERRFPVHINLRDCYGLRSPGEVLRRHAEDLGFPQESSLLAAWRSGACSLLLDGFDELIPSRWVGGARDLKQVRWHALEPVRRLISETPSGAGVLIAGRSQYFSTDEELLEALGLPHGAVVALRDLTDQQAQALVGPSAAALPDWVPNKPLLLKFLAQNGLIGQLSGSEVEPSAAWCEMLDVVAAREADRIASVTRDSVRSLIGRIATMARATDSGLGPVLVEDMRTAFREICGYEPDEEGLQLLLRLPGLGQSTPGTAFESRSFADVSLAQAAYGQDLADHVSAPYAQHPLAEGVLWAAASAELSVGVASHRLGDVGFDGSGAASALKRRLDRGYFDAPLFDLARVADHMGGGIAGGASPFFGEVIIDRLALSGVAQEIVNRATFKDCVIDILDVADLDDTSKLPTFQDCLIGRVDGWATIPTWAQAALQSSEITEFSSDASTTSGLLALDQDDDDKIALVILKKVYTQIGNGRRESALPRGLPVHSRGRVPAVTATLMSLGLLGHATGRGENIIVGRKERRPEVEAYLAAPHAFTLASLRNQA